MTKRQYSKQGQGTKKPSPKPTTQKTPSKKKAGGQGAKQTMPLRIIPLGGLGEIGKNMTALLSKRFPVDHNKNAAVQLEERLPLLNCPYAPPAKSSSSPKYKNLYIKGL